MLDPIERLVVRAFRRSEMAAPGARVLAAVSGGSDSVALVWLLRAVAARAGIELAGLVHVHHGLRAGDADLDEAFCRALADRLGCPCYVSRVDVAALARARRRSIEAAAREARDAAFADAAARSGASRVATGHTLDDQAETVLLRLLRGAGARGLTGIRARRGMVIRPLLECRREALRAYLAARGEAFREDASNADLGIPRNRVRHELLPVIDRIAPGARRALARVAALAADDETFFRGLVTELTSSVVLSSEGVRLEALGAHPPALARRLARWAVERVAPDAALTVRHLDAMVGLAASRAGSGHLDLPGVVVERRGTSLFVVAATGRRRATPGAQFEYPLPCPGQVVVPECGVTVLAAAGGPGVPEDLPADGDVAAVGVGTVRPPFRVRNRRPGDRLRPLGAPGRRKLQDVLVDRKVAAEDRDRVPVVTDVNGRIVWVAGVAVAEDARVTTASAGVVILSLKKGNP